MRRTSPSTRIIGGKPADKCKSDAPCLALKARSSVISIRATFLLYVGQADLCYESLQPDMHKIDDKLRKVTARIHQAAAAAGRNPQTVQLIAVSKTQSAEMVAEAYIAGQRAFG